MLILFKKSRTSQGVLYCTRGDGSQSWSKMHPGLELHDLAHYVVESHLGYRNAFFGLIEQGHEIGDFELPREQRPQALQPAKLPVEAIYAEYIVNQLQTDYATGGTTSVFLDTLNNTLQTKGLPFPEGLDQHLVNLLRVKYRALVYQWMTLPPGQALEFQLDLD